MYWLWIPGRMCCELSMWCLFLRLVCLFVFKVLWSDSSITSVTKSSSEVTEFISKVRWFKGSYKNYRVPFIMVRRQPDAHGRYLEPGQWVQGGQSRPGAACGPPPSVVENWAGQKDVSPRAPGLFGWWRFVALLPQLREGRHGRQWAQTPPASTFVYMYMYMLNISVCVYFFKY